MLYKYPDGNVSGTHDFTANDVQYNQEIFYKWTLEQLKAIGVKPYREELIPYGYDAGLPLEIETNDEFVKTYPNPIPNVSKVKNDLDILIKSTRKSFEENGFIYTDTDLRVFIATDLKGSLRVSQLQMMFAANPDATVEWQGADPDVLTNDKWFTMTYSRWVSIVGTGMLFIQACFNKQKALQDEMNTFTTVDELLIFKETIKVGWPT